MSRHSLWYDREFQLGTWVHCEKIIFMTIQRSLRMIHNSDYIMKQKCRLKIKKMGRNPTVNLRY